jgi:hypothetical protein
MLVKQHVVFETLIEVTRGGKPVATDFPIVEAFV